VLSVAALLRLIMIMIAAILVKVQGQKSAMSFA
jgi:hypothetical protein